MVAEVCQVQFGGAVVGTLAYTDDSGLASFEYSREWLNDGFSLAPLHLPLKPSVFKFPQLAPATFKGLPAIFADSLPDDFGHALINRWCAAQGLDPAQFSALDRLLYIGTRGMGALEYQPAQNLNSTQPRVLQLDELVRLAQEVLDTRQAFHHEVTSQADLSPLFQVGTSAGGARAKAIIAINQERTVVLSGQADVAEGFTHYLLKFDGVVEHQAERETFGDPKGFGLMEYAYAVMAGRCQIDMSPCELLRENGRSHFMTQRFDRVGAQKYHVASLCAMAHADYKQPGQFSYEELLQVARTLGLSQQEQIQLFRRMVFNVVARNQDDHTKNTAFYVNDELRWCLAPAYDLAFSYKPDSIWVARHQMSINGKLDHFNRDDLLAVARLISRFSASKAGRIIDEIIRVVKDWPAIAEEVGVFPALRDEVGRYLRLSL